MPEGKNSLGRGEGGLERAGSTKKNTRFLLVKGGTDIEEWRGSQGGGIFPKKRPGHNETEKALGEKHTEIRKRREVFLAEKCAGTLAHE